MRSLPWVGVSLAVVLHGSAPAPARPEWPAETAAHMKDALTHVHCGCLNDKYDTRCFYYEKDALGNGRCRCDCARGPKVLCRESSKEPCTSNDRCPLPCHGSLSACCVHALPSTWMCWVVMGRIMTTLCVTSLASLADLTPALVAPVYGCTPRQESVPQNQLLTCVSLPFVPRSVFRDRTRRAWRRSGSVLLHVCMFTTSTWGTLANYFYPTPL